MTWVDLPVAILVAVFGLVEAGYVTHRWLTVSQEVARVRRAHPTFAVFTIGVVLATLAIHLAFGWES